jgi:hypothetical protein
MFLQDVPLTGLLFCYGPLILTVLGFIVFAALTDGNARRTYLRRKIGSEEKNLGNQVNTLMRSKTVVTPAGSYLTVQPNPPVQVVAPTAPELPVSSAPPALATGEASEEGAKGGEAPKRRRRRSTSSTSSTTSESSEGGEAGNTDETPASDASGDESS